MDDREKFENYFKRFNSTYICKQFAEAIKKNDNEIIENTTIYKLLTLLLSASIAQFKETLSPETILYRGRIIDISDKNTLKKIKVSKNNEIQGLNKYESKEAPLHRPRDGRNNIAGVSYLYVARDLYTAVAECKPLSRSFLSVAKFQIIQKMRIFNLCDNDSIVEIEKNIDKKFWDASVAVTNIMRYFHAQTPLTEDIYLITQYISDLTRKYGYDGIAYRSGITEGKNYTIFNCCEKNIRFISSELIYVQGVHLNAVALNSGELIRNPNNVSLFTPEDCTYIRKDIIRRCQSTE